MQLFKAIYNHVYFTLLQTLNILQRYIPFTRKEIGVGSMENGDAYYRNVLKWHLSANVTPEEVHRIGLAEVDRIKVEMEKVSCV